MIGFNRILLRLGRYFVEKDRFRQICIAGGYFGEGK